MNAYFKFIIFLLLKYLGKGVLAYLNLNHTSILVFESKPDVDIYWYRNLNNNVCK